MVLDMIRRKYSEHIFAIPVEKTETSRKDSEICIESVRTLLHAQTGLQKDSFLIRCDGAVKVGWVKVSTLTADISECFTKGSGHINDNQLLPSTDRHENIISTKMRLCHTIYCRSLDELHKLAKEKIIEVGKDSVLHSSFSDVLKKYVKNCINQQNPVYISNFFVNNGGCTLCDADGKVICSACDGKGGTTCTCCYGKKIGQCEDCFGKGEKECSECSGWGSATYKYPEENKSICSHCGGKGWTYSVDYDDNNRVYHDTCSSCNGSGGHTSNYTRTSIETCHSCGGARKKTCKSCNGRGIINCPQCLGTGWINCEICHGSSKVTCSACEGTKKRHVKFQIVATPYITTSIVLPHSIKLDTSQYNDGYEFVAHLENTKGNIYVYVLKRQITTSKLSISIKGIEYSFDFLVDNTAISKETFDPLYSFLLRNTLQAESAFLRQKSKGGVSVKRKIRKLKELLASDYAVSLLDQESAPIHQEFKEVITKLLLQIKKTQSEHASVCILVVGGVLAFLYYSESYQRLIVSLTNHHQLFNYALRYPKISTFIFSFLLSWIAGMLFIAFNRSSARALFSNRPAHSKSDQITFFLAWAQKNELLLEYKESYTYALGGVFITAITMYSIYLFPQIKSFIMTIIAS